MIQISYQKLSDNFINALRHGRRQSVLVVHGPEDIAAIFDPAFSLKSYLSECVRHVSIDNAPALSVPEYRERADAEQRAAKAISKPAVMELLRELAIPGAEALAGTLAAGKGAAGLSQELVELLDAFPHVLLSGDQDGVEGLVAYVKAANAKLPKFEQKSDKHFYTGTFMAALPLAQYTPLHEAFGQRFSCLSDEVRREAEESLLEAWQEHFGSYEVENILARATRPLWDNLAGTTKRVLIELFVDIVNSHRFEGYPQLQLAKGVLNGDADQGLSDEVIKGAIRDRMQQRWPSDEADSINWWVRHSFEKLGRLLGDRFGRLFEEARQEDQGGTATDSDVE